MMLQLRKSSGALTMPKSRQESRNFSVGLKAQYSRRGGEGKEEEVEAVAR